MCFGIAFLYSGLVRFKNSISSAFQVFCVIPLVSLVWYLVGFSLVFSEGSTLIGGRQFFTGKGLSFSILEGPVTDTNLIFFMFQMTFAIVASIIVIGSVLERWSLKNTILFTPIWTLLVYIPVAHWTWGPGGWVKELGGVDFAGGLVVHITSGFSSLALTLTIGRRKNYFHFIEKYNNHLILMGTALIWVGWFGFNGQRSPR